MASRAAIARKASHSTLGGLLSGGSTSSLPGLPEEIALPNIALSYETGWAKPHIHYRPVQGEWTQVPGVPFTKSGDAWAVNIPATGVEFVCNDGIPTGWDKAPGDQNYNIQAPGAYKLAGGRIERLLLPPKPPVLVVASEVGGSAIHLSWNPPDATAQEVDEIRGYRVYRNGEKVHDADRSMTWVNGGLKGNTEYTFEVASVNLQGIESVGRAQFSVRTNLPGRPGPPVFLKVSGNSSDFVELSWQPPRDLGGASVTAYNVYRDGVFSGLLLSRDPHTGRDREILEWRDNNVEQDREYSYEVTAVHMPDGAMARSRSQAELIEALHRAASNSLLSVDEDANEGPKSDQVLAKAVAMLKEPRLGDREPHIMLQAYNWDSFSNKEGWYKVLLGSVGQMRDAGIDMVWMPPPSASVDGRGYLPGEWYNLNSHYGTEAELKQLIQAMQAAGITAIADLVLNHRCAQQQDGNGKWSIFKNPDWGPWAICGDDPGGLGQGGQSTGENITYAPDIDHTNKKIQEDTKAFIKFLMEQVGFRALRLDFVLGYAPWLQEQYIRGAGAPYCVAEYWHGDVGVLKNYINATKGLSAVYDFPVYYTLRNAIRSNDFSGLNQNGRLPGVMGSDPERAVTFIENHDTCHLEVVGGKFGDNEQVTRAYAFILTHSGIPSIFWSDWADRGGEVTKQLVALCKLRKDIGLHCTSNVHINAAYGGLYAAYVDGTNGTVAFKMGSNDWAPHGDGWTKRASGNGYAVWAKGGSTA